MDKICGRVNTKKRLEKVSTAICNLRIMLINLLHENIKFTA